jgi:DNA polymerase-3 subunit gamma/tau
MIIERFFRVIADAKGLLALGSDGEFVLTLTLFKMMEALEIKDIDAMIRGLERELKGVEVSEIMVTTQPETEVITITEDEIVATLSKREKHNLQQAQVPENETVSSTQDPLIEPTEPPTPLTSSDTETTSIDLATEVNKVANPAEAAKPHQKTFDTLIKKIYDRNYDLGKLFEENITFVTFEEKKLTWESTAEGEEKKQLITHWGLINMFVKELFGFETKIVNIAKKKVVNTSTGPDTEANNIDHSTKINNAVVEPTEAKSTPHSDANSGSMIEEIEMKSSCIAPEAGNTEAAKEKDPSTLLQEPMIKEAIALFAPKKVRIKKNT